MKKNCLGRYSQILNRDIITKISEKETMAITEYLEARTKLKKVEYLLRIGEIFTSETPEEEENSFLIFRKSLQIGFINYDVTTIN